MPKAKIGTARAAALATATALCVSGTMALTPVASAQSTTTSPAASHLAMSAGASTVMSTRRAAFGAAADTYVAFRRPNYRPGDSRKLVASNRPHNRKVSYLKFTVHGIPSSAEVTAATLVLHRNHHRLPSSTLRLHRVDSTDWTQGDLDARRAPGGDGVLGSRRTNRDETNLTFSVRQDVRHDGTYAFALTSTSRADVARFRSRETGEGPRLVVMYRVPKLLAGDPLPVTSPSQPTVGSGGDCSLSATLVPSCGILFGGALSSFGGDNLYSQYTNFNEESGTHMVLQHDYRRPGQTLSPWDVEVADTPGALLQLNWKPTGEWSDADGSDPAVNAQIDAMAESIKALGSHKIFLTIFHEPENDVSGGAAGCPSSIYKGSAGTPAQYRAMWANIESRFDALGVTNVVWVMNYMNWHVWDCMINDLWPGNSLVDWVFFESYAGDGDSFNAETSHFYNLLTQDSDATHDYLSKPWGIGEFGTSMTSPADQDRYYLDIKSDLDNNVYPRLKLMSAYDIDISGNDFRVAYDHDSSWDPAKLAAFDLLGNDPSVLGGDASVATSWS